ncbi:hypothetical protein ACHAWF_001549 [Thalassiosira exigua]
MSPSRGCNVTTCRGTSAGRSRRLDEAPEKGRLRTPWTAFVNLVQLATGSINESIRRLFNLIFRALLPEEVTHFMSDSYLFCLLKDPSDHS